MPQETSGKDVVDASTMRQAIDGYEYAWNLGVDGIEITNADGDVLDLAAAQVIISLGGTEPAWYPTVSALTAAYQLSEGKWGDSLAHAASALSLSPSRRGDLARTTSDKAVLAALASAGTVAAARNPQCDRTIW